MPMTLHVDLSLCLSPCRMCLLSLPSVSQYMGGGGRKLLESAFLRLVTSKSGGSNRVGGSKKAVGRRQKDKAVVGTKKKVSTPYLQHVLAFFVLFQMLLVVDGPGTDLCVLLCC